MGWNSSYYGTYSKKQIEISSYYVFMVFFQICRGVIFFECPHPWWLLLVRFYIPNCVISLLLPFISNSSERLLVTLVMVLRCSWSYDGSHIFFLVAILFLALGFFWSHLFPQQLTQLNNSNEHDWMKALKEDL
jgi:hypothetical protein